MGQPDFTSIERRTYAVLEGLADELSPSERKEVVDFVEVGEYGVALETLCALLVEERKNIPATVFAQIVELAASMDIRDTAITSELEARVTPA